MIVRFPCIRKLSAAIVILLLVTACGTRSTARSTPGDSRVSATPSASASLTGSASPTASVTPPGSLSASASPSGPSVTCTTGVAAQNLVLMGGENAGYLLYEVSDPVRPKLLCRITSTSAHIVNAASIAYVKGVSPTETDVTVRALQTGVEVVAARFPFAAQGSPFATASWRPDGSLLVYTASPDNPGPGSTAQVWLYSDQTLKLLTTYPWPLTDCICRFGFPPQENALSADGQFVVSGWPVGKGAEPFQVYRVADRKQVQVFDLTVSEVIWDRTGHRLYLIGQGGVRSWTPEAGITTLTGASAWSFFPSLSPNDSQAVYTAYIDQGQKEPRAFTYDFATAVTHQLSSLPRTQVMFVKSGWVWYLEEAACQSGQGQCPPWGSAPTGKVYAQDLATGHESEVVFAAGEGVPVATNWYLFQPQDLWPPT